MDKTTGKPVDTMTNESVAMHALFYAQDGKDPSEAIYLQERLGQRAFLASDTIPTRGPDDGQLVALGFELGDVVEGDPMFRYAKLPEGWTREGSDHDMWSYILDERGRSRCSVFYKAAFYDRSANMGITPMEGPNGKVYADHEFVPDPDPSWASSCDYGKDRSVEYSRSTCGQSPSHRTHHPESDVPRGDDKLY